MPVKLRPVKASEYIHFTSHYQNLIRQHGGVAVNDKLMPLWEHKYDMALLYGGRGGGKSEAVCDKLLDACLTDNYFKCYYGRKVFDTVRGSCFATLVYCIKKNALESEFSFSESESSTMVITCRRNGNKFIPFGSDKADKLKSIKDPTHLWCEEFDQFTFADFKELYPTLRTIRGANIFFGTFNTHGVLPSHWLLKLFFPSQYQGLEKDDANMVNLLEGKKVTKVFVNFTDNYFIDQDKYRKNLWLAAAGNTTIFQGIANGAWGMQANDSPWLYAFSREKHVVKAELKANKAEILYLSFDFNRNPQVCTIIQWPGQKKVQIIEVIKEFNVGTEGICDLLLARYPGYLYVVTGDYSGETASSLFKEQVTNYSVIKKKLNLTDSQIKISPNPKLEKNQTLVNMIFHQYPVEVCPQKARPFIFDAENVQKRADGKILKEDRDDPAQQADTLDTVRYWCNQFMGWFVKM